jgi:hypothetical protein
LEEAMSTRSITGTLLTVVLAAAAPAAFAQAAAEKPKAPAPPKPAAEMSNLKFFDGSWTCSGEGMMEPGAPMVKMSSAVKSQTDMNGFWQSGTVKGGPAGTPPMEGMFHMTWDAAAKQYVMFWMDNMGGFSEQRSSGWDGNKIVFTGHMQMGDQKMASRDTFTKNADGSMTHTGEMEVGGSWMKGMEESCRKAGGR